jgi:hypothetical protein
MWAEIDFPEDEIEPASKHSMESMKSIGRNAGAAENI